MDLQPAADPYNVVCRPTLLCCDYSTLWEALHVNMMEIGARCSDKNVKILGRYQWIG